MERDEVTLTPRDFNDLLFERFYADLERGMLAEVPDPTPERLTALREQREELLSRFRPDELSGERLTRAGRLLLSNERIPLEVAARVETVYEHYFHDLKPLLGMVRQCQDAKQKLYGYYGYEWHTTSEIYPGLLID